MIRCPENSSIKLCSQKKKKLCSLPAIRPHVFLSTHLESEAGISYLSSLLLLWKPEDLKASSSAHTMVIVVPSNLLSSLVSWVSLFSPPNKWADTHSAGCLCVLTRACIVSLSLESVCLGSVLKQSREDWVCGASGSLVAHTSSSRDTNPLSVLPY